MYDALSLRSKPAPIQAVAVSGDLRHFDMLIEDMEAELGDAWKDMTLSESLALMRQPADLGLSFLTLALRAEDEQQIEDWTHLIEVAASRGVPVIVVGEDLSPVLQQACLDHGAFSILSYPLDRSTLHDGITKIRGGQVGKPDGSGDRQPPPNMPIDPSRVLPGKAAIFGVQPLAGGTGASTLAVNMAWELANIEKQRPPSVCLIDFCLQHGSVSTYLDLPRRDTGVDVLQEASRLDEQAFKQALVGYQGRLSVLAAPHELLPLDLIGPAEVDALLNLASACFDIVILDLPKTFTAWSEAVITRADVFFTTLELDMRSAQNAMRVLQALQAENLPVEKLNFVLNRAPGLTDLAGHSRTRRLADTLGVNIATLLPDGGKAVTQAGDNGAPLAETAAKNPLRREILKLCKGLHKAMLNNAAMAS